MTPNAKIKVLVGGDEPMVREVLRCNLNATVAVTTSSVSGVGRS